MKGTILVYLNFGLYLAAGKMQYGQYQSFLGCFRDNSQRDFKKYFGKLNSLEKCRKKAQKKGLQIFRTAKWG
jgi:hypothetical protein